MVEQEERLRQFNTAVFFDIENLIGGYGGDSGILDNLSLREILKQIKNSGTSGGIAISRAYANWSDGRLNVLRGELVELGIEPVQVYGFSKGPQRNAADIQLAIDAIETLYERRGIEVFVIVSGDGAFSAVAKRLHAHGRLVVGCAYRKATNRVFEAVCDDFIWLDPPRSTSPNEAAGRDEQPRGAGRIGPNLVPGAEAVAADQVLYAELLRGLPALEQYDRASAVKIWRKLLGRLDRTPPFRDQLRATGLFLNIAKAALRQLLPGFDEDTLGFVKFVEFCRYASTGTPVCVASSAGVPRLWLRSALGPASGEILSDLDDAQLFSASPERYRAVLAAAPTLRLPESGALVLAVAAHLAAREVKQSGFAELIEEIVTQVESASNREEIKYLLRSLANSGCLYREPEGHSEVEQICMLADDCTTTAAIVGRLREVCAQRIKYYLGQVDETILDTIVPRL